jgi:hypothetical protein
MDRQSKSLSVDNHPNPIDRWRNRRCMAWIALLCGCVYPVFALLTGSPHLAEIAWPFYTFIGAIVGAYVGFATVDDKWQRSRDFGGREYGRNDF